MKHLLPPSRIGLSREEILSLLSDGVTPETVSNVILANNEKFQHFLDSLSKNVAESFEQLEK